MLAELNTISRSPSPSPSRSPSPSLFPSVCARARVCGCRWCEDAVQELIETQFEIYLGGLTITADNAAELSAAMVSGLRVWLCDPTVRESESARAR
eukprot:COSAG03_NODE_8923_length_759_cov_541.839394_2_plen_95_part_01